jgi:hypothetical protein
MYLLSDKERLSRSNNTSFLPTQEDGTDTEFRNVGL